MDIPGLSGRGDTYEDQGRWGVVTPEAATLAANEALEVDKAPISETVHTRVLEAVEMGLGA